MLSEKKHPFCLLQPANTQHGLDVKMFLKLIHGIWTRPAIHSFNISTQMLYNIRYCLTDSSRAADPILVLIHIYHCMTGLEGLGCSKDEKRKRKRKESSNELGCPGIYLPLKKYSWLQQWKGPSESQLC